jgi:1-aminocyclopropane-1-carboxylate deaminase/D-cysteine desulfhydrase-like pyridoxal-dependent ACC family enzyme
MGIETAFENYPSEKLLSGLAFLQFLPYLGDLLDINLNFKRNDLTTLAIGGDKLRKLDSEVSQAKALCADILVTSNRPPATISNDLAVSCRWVPLVNYRCLPYRQ